MPRLFFDEPLSEELCEAVADIFPGSLHIRLMGQGGAADAIVWDLARQHECLVVRNREPRHATKQVALYSEVQERMPNTDPVVHSDPDILSGAPVFVGTRVPVQSLFDYLEGGDTLDEFLRQFPSVRRDQAIAALELARDSVLNGPRSA